METANVSKMYYGSTSKCDAPSSSINEFTHKSIYDSRHEGLKNNNNINMSNQYEHKQYVREAEDGMFDEDDNIEYGDEDDEYGESEDSYSLESKKKNNIFFRCCDSSLSCIKQKCLQITALLNVLANIDNEWDSPTSTTPSRYLQYDEAQLSTLQHKLVVFFWFAVLAFAYAVERSSFKILVDRAGPFRLFSAQIITSAHAIVTGFGVLISAIVNKSSLIKPLGIPLTNICVMALIDSIYLLFSIISASHVSPVLTVIIVQFTIPLTVYMSQCFIYNSKNISSSEQYSTITDYAHERQNNDVYNIDREMDTEPTKTELTRQHIIGASIISIAVIIAIFPALIEVLNPSSGLPQGVSKITTEGAQNTIVFTLACIPAAASTLYKEYTLFHYKQPVDPSYMNFFQSLFQFMIAIAISPLLFPLQGLGYSASSSSSKVSDADYKSWLNLYPSDQVGPNFLDGLKCFGFGENLVSNIQMQGYAEPATCNDMGMIVICYVFSLLIVGIAVDKIIHAGTIKIMYRGIGAGFILAVCSMFVYENLSNATQHEVTYANWFYFICVVLLMIGFEVYHRRSLPHASFETSYPEINNLYEE